VPFLDRRAYDKARPARRASGPAETRRRKAYDKTRPKRVATIVGVDGEGMDTPDGRHIYTYLAAVTERGVLVADAYNPNGLTHEECAEMLLSIPRNSLKFGFMFSYDVTKIIEELASADKYYLMRPDTRAARICRACKQKWKTREPACPKCGGLKFQSVTEGLRLRGRSYGFFNGSLSIGADNGKRGARKVKVWDCFRFFGCAFVEAIKDWDVATADEIASIKEMKDQRGSFDTADPEKVKAYCRHECHLLAKMMRKVIDAHNAAGIPLKRYEGAGSTATSLLKRFGVSDYKGPSLREMPIGLAHAISAAFFGGRFENSRIGIVRQPVESYDISSAYPYALSFLPCLKCGRWEHVTGSAREVLARIKKADLAVAKFRVGALDAATRRGMAWGPLPCRDERGSICYGSNFEGWAWKPELLPALAWPHVKLAGEAWVYSTRCKHRPFSFLPEVYRQRIAWGKEGKGKALKLGSNASYGKTAQTLGEDPPFQSWVWAGNTTATCRGQILDVLRLARDPWSVLAIATDGIYTTEKLDMPAPKKTGTGDLAKPLGGWEHKTISEGAFLAKPGLYFRLHASFNEIRARGVGRREVFEQRARMLSEFERWDRKDFGFYVAMTSRRFYGAKTSVLARSKCLPCGVSWPGIPEQRCPSCGRVGDSFKTSEMVTAEGKPAYGTWNLREVRVKFDPHPKRERRLDPRGSSTKLRMRDLAGLVSAPYKTGVTTPEGIAARASADFALEQPDWEGSSSEDFEI